MPADSAVQYSFATPSTSGSTTLVPAQGTQRICVLQMCVITGAANNIKFQSNGSTDISANFPLAANGGFVLPYNGIGWFSTNLAESLTVTITASAATAIQVVWCPHTF